MSRLRFAILLMPFVGFAAPQGVAAAQECPTAQTSGNGFATVRGSSRMEVLRDEPIVRTILRVGGSVVLETTQFELDRIDRGRRSIFKPKTDLAKLFPLKTGERLTADFDVSGASTPATNRRILLHVLAVDELYIGKCKYRVFKIEHNEARSEAPPTFFEFDYYSPDLKLIIAKEFKERDGRTTLNKYDAISPIGN